jgi:hypothetical protein
MRNLCDTCMKQMPTCDADEIVWGIDVEPSTTYTKDSDAVVECDAYMEATDEG